jgi:XRE family transcriptional regulator, aerobic/anaerobic benzoate catabolism transcriptional regulator
MHSPFIKINIPYYIAGANGSQHAVYFTYLRSHMHQHTLLSQIGARVRTRRISMGWTLREIAERSGVSSRFLSDLEGGKGNISVARLADVARALDVPLVALLPSDDEQSLVVSLVGLRGAGKSTIGKSLAKHLRVSFLELDTLIEKEANLSLAELFSLHGESYYKRLAYDLLLRLLAQSEQKVIATGGSVVTDPETWQLLKRRTHTVWVKASPEDHWKRVLGQGDTRPMANRTSAMAELRSILSLRAPLYAEAAQTIDTSAVRVTEAVRLVSAALRQRVEKIGRKK